MICFRGCSSEQRMFQTLGLQVNKYLREKVEIEDELLVESTFNYDFYVNTAQNIELFKKLATDYDRTKNFLDEAWENFGNFSKHWKDEEIFSFLEDKVELLNEKCSDSDFACLHNVEKAMRSVYALGEIARSPPKSPGLYLAYHMNRIFSDEYSYMRESSKWPMDLYGGPDDMTQLFDNHLKNFLFQLSNGTLKNISLLDLPGFGAMNHVKYWNCFLPWPNQLSMAIHHKNGAIDWGPSSDISHAVQEECNILNDAWAYYTQYNSSASNFPPDLVDNISFNFTNYIKEDMKTFLAAYSASFLTVGKRETVEALFKNAAKNVFSEIISDDDVTPTYLGRFYHYYDKLIMECVYQTPLMSHDPDIVNACLDFKPILTSNGLCHSFNGIETAKMWFDSEIIQSFNAVFGRFQNLKKQFRGIGPSEGNQ